LHHIKKQQLPYKEKIIEKLYYSIGEVAEMFDVNTSLIRFWEKEFDIINPQKSKKGNRMFTATDVKNFRLIYHLVKERGFTLQGANEKLKQNKNEALGNVDVIDKLQKLKSFLLKLKEEL
jgi:DNA-binding transcriptional MerR regulator